MNDTDDRLHKEIAARLAALDQRYTEHRRRLVDVLVFGGRPLTIAEILGVAPEIPQSSAYRNLTLLAESGVVRRVWGSGDSGRFELAEDLSGHHHHHVVCAECGAVADVGAIPRLERMLAEASKVAAEETGFELLDHRIDLVGRCALCR